jgi:hypothetical protein
MSKSRATRLKDLVLFLSTDADALYRYSLNPAAFLRKRGFPESVVQAILSGSKWLQALLTTKGGKPPVIFQVQGIKGYRPKSTARRRAGGRGKKKAATKGRTRISRAKKR